MFRDSRSPGSIDELLEVFRLRARSAEIPSHFRERCVQFRKAVGTTIRIAFGGASEGFAQLAITRLNGSNNAFLDYFGRQSIQRALEWIARVYALAENPRFAILPMDIVAEQRPIKLVDIGLVGKHDMPGIVESEAVGFKRPAPTAHAVVLFQQQGAFAEMISGAETGRSGADR